METQPQPQRFMTPERARAFKREQRKRYMVGMVDPQGVVRSIVCMPSEKGRSNGLRRGLVPVELIEGKVVMTEYGEAAGWRSLEEWCITEGCRERYLEWLRVAHAKENRQHIEVPDLRAIYPDGLIEMRANKKAQSSTLVYVAGQGNVEMRGLTLEQKKERAKKLADTLDGLDRADGEPVDPLGGVA